MPRAQCWAPGAIGRAGRQAGVLGGSAGAPGQWLVTQNVGGDAVRGDQDCWWPIRTGADETGWRAVTQDAWEERQTDRQKTDREIHGIAPEDSPIPPRHMVPRDSDRTEPEPARTWMDGEDGISVLGVGWVGSTHPGQRTLCGPSAANT